ncbi:MAG TPA: hypothetical protein EYQ31_15660, partial [Candidatus Handelsmanbacteria bacterium]|nr:hypothetical protein [Candidatus Handelsmanbacteria bacterium]
MTRYSAMLVLGICVSLSSGVLRAEVFDVGSVVLPADNTWQDTGGLEIYGLAYQLLLNDVPLQWIIEPGKSKGD